MTAGTSVTGPGQAGLSARLRSVLTQRRLTILLFLLPPLAVYLLFVLFPMVQAVNYSLYDWNGIAPLDDYVGLANYERALADERFLSAMWNNWLIVILSLTIQIPIALGLAMLLNQEVRGRWLFRLIFFAPYVVSEVIAALLWRLILRGGGAGEAFLDGSGLGGLIEMRLGNPDTIMYVVFFVISWKYFGFHMILLLAGLQGIPRELGEAAEIDGASRWQVARRITIPLLGPTLRISVFLSIIGSLQLFDLVWVMTTGGPLHASETMAIFMYDWGFIRFQFGYGSAVAVIMFTIALVLALFYQRYVIRRDIEGAVTAQGG